MLPVLNAICPRIGSDRHNSAMSGPCFRIHEPFDAKVLLLASQGEILLPLWKIVSLNFQNLNMGGRCRSLWAMCLI